MHIPVVQGNPFPTLFHAAAEAAGCVIEYDGFDSCIGQVAFASQVLLPASSGI